VELEERDCLRGILNDSNQKIGLASTGRGTECEKAGARTEDE